MSDNSCSCPTVLLNREAHEHYLRYILYNGLGKHGMDIDTQRLPIVCLFHLFNVNDI